MIPYLKLLPILPFLALSAWAADPITRLVPAPKTLRVDDGSLVVPQSARIIFSTKELEPLAKILAEEIFRCTGVKLATASGKAHPGDVLLELDSKLKSEAYTVEVKNGILVKGGNYPATASATVTLLQSLVMKDGTLTVPRMKIEDEPTYPYRSALIDPGRKYHSPGGIEQVIELCRMYKIRYLQLHLTDDQLFMFPSSQFPQLGKSNQEFARFEPAAQPYCAPYTLAELKALEVFARDRGVFLVPEIDLPGHSGRLIADAPDIFGIPGNGSTVNIASPKTFEAITVLINEVMDVFESSPYIHLGADEVGLGGIDQTEEYKLAQSTHGIKTVHDLYCKFVADLHAVVVKRGKKAIVWEEAWNPNGAYPLPKEAIVMSWSHFHDPAEIIKSGYQVINASWTPLYIVRSDKRPLDFLFEWKVPMFGQGHLENDNFTTLKTSDGILGAQLSSWENSESIEIQSMRERLALVGERTWNPTAGGTLEGFKQRLAQTDALLDKLVHPISIRTDGTFVKDENTFTDPLTITLEPRVKDFTMKYTLDNTLPNEEWKTYEGPIRTEQSVHLRAGLFDSAGKQKGRLVGAWFRAEIPVKPNLATGKPVTVGPAADRTDAWSAKMAVDGHSDNADEHWASEGDGPQWLQVDLGKVQPVDFINVITYWDGGRYYQLTAELSVDGKEWKQVLDFSKDTAPATSDGYSGKFKPVQARYARINMLKNSANPSFHIVELIVDGPK